MSDFTGTTKINGSPASCIVRAYLRDTGEMTHEVTSSPLNGEYTLTDIYSFNDYDIVCLPNSNTITPQIIGTISGDPNDEFMAVGGIENLITVNGIAYKVHTFTESSTFIIQGKATEVEYLIVGGGGGGGANNTGGGGGAGGVIMGSISKSTSENAITVGNGGNGVIGNTQGENGQDSSAFGLIAIGGGGGGAGRSNNPAGQRGQDGGSGGGGGGTWNDSAAPHLGGTATPNQGHDGGAGISTPYTNQRASGGGGGAGSVGQNASSGNGGNGGDGIASSISGEDLYYAGGGGGSTIGSTIGSGGIGGGGNGGHSGGMATSAQPNTGGGGGGQQERHGSYQSGNGGSGIVILRYKLE